ncbi:YeiH family protein [Catenulispora sp. GP43]|uniref:YeiH family protein n=1 Tax=Catenulispora sp. GP43 TaxID=3156263 RepID=UPI0035171265
MGRSWIAGLALTAGAVVVAWFANRMWPTLSPLTAAVVLGVLAANLLPAPAMAAARPGLQIAAKRVMRLGIVLLGLQLALGDVLKLGWQTLALVVAVVFATFFGTQWLGRRMGLPGRQPLLIATGFAICGASAVAAMEGVTRRPGESEDDPDPVVAVALVTLCGSLAILVLPLLRGPLGLHDPAMFGHWVGASVHDVGQVVATAGSGGAVAVNGAVVVKLMRVAMLAPMVAGTAVAWRRRAAAAPVEMVAAPVRVPVGVGAGAYTHEEIETAQPSSEPPVQAPKHPPIVPLFVAGFLAMIAIRTAGVLPASTLGAAKQLQDLLLAGGMFGLGTGVRLRELARTGAKPLALGLASWALIASAAYIGVRLTS